MNNSLTISYFSFFYLNSYGYAKVKELCPDHQVANPYSIIGTVILANQPNS